MIVPAPLTEKIERSTWASCPACAHADVFRVDHVLTEPGRVFGPWSCDHCGKSFRGWVEAGGLLFLEDTGAMRIPRASVLWARADCLVAVQAFPQDFDDDNFRYHYNEHSCPMNVIRSTTHVFKDDDPDPHGAFEYLESVELTWAEAARMEDGEDESCPKAVLDIVKRATGEGIR